MFAACTYGLSEPNFRIVEHFLDEHFPEARRLGWSDVDLFGCYPDPAFVAVRYDAMGAVTIAALTKTRIASLSATEIRGADGLASRRPLPSRLARPVWIVFPAKSEGAVL